MYAIVRRVCPPSGSRFGLPAISSGLHSGDAGITIAPCVRWLEHELIR